MTKIGLISLGCSKNQVDSEIMLGLINKSMSYEIVDNLEIADVIIINTCGFIQDAKEESIETILDAARLKDIGNLKTLIVSGCLTQRYQDELMTEIPEIDAIIGTGTFDQILSVINDTISGKKINLIGKSKFDYKADLPRIITEKHFAYVKIAEGCNNNCTYCSIPGIRGPLYSRKIEDIIAEVKNLTQQGVKEIILIAQDTTQYGLDIYRESKIVELLNHLGNINELNWVRLLYSYPERVSAELIDIIAKNNKICNYLDLPVQHSSNNIRKKMNRRGTRKELIETITNIRKRIPDIALRTSLIVGFPGETEEDFLDLLSFVREIKFDRLGVFKYSREEGTTAANLPEQITDRIKEIRYNIIMETQREISYEKNQHFIDKEMTVLIDDISQGTAIGRSCYDAPEIDNQVILPAQNIKPGDLVECIIKEAYEYDLIGEIKR